MGPKNKYHFQVKIVKSRHDFSMVFCPVLELEEKDSEALMAGFAQRRKQLRFLKHLLEEDL